MMAMRGALMVVVLAALLGWWLYQPVPRGFSQPKRLRLVLALSKAGLAAARGLNYFGIMSMNDSTGALLRLILPGDDPGSHAGVLVGDVRLGGVPVRLYSPAVGEPSAAEEGRGGLVYYHGGGWVMGHPRLYDTMMVELVRTHGVVIASVNYRLAPEHPFPIPLEDCLAATRAFMDRATDMGVDSTRVALAGDSAGGNLATAVALTLRNDEASPPRQPKLLLLIQPALQAVDFKLPSYVQNWRDPLVSGADNAWFWSVYLAGHSGYASAFKNNSHTSVVIKKSLAKTYLRHENLQMEYFYAPYQRPDLDHGDTALWQTLQKVVLNQYVSPLLADDVTGLPKTHVITAHYDVVRDDGLLFVHRLEETGSDVTHSHMPKGFHGLLPLMDMGFVESRAIIEDVIRFLRKL